MPKLSRERFIHNFGRTMTVAQKLAVVFVLGVVAAIAAAPFSKQRAINEQVADGTNNRLHWQEGNARQPDSLKTLSKPIQETDVNVLASIVGDNTTRERTASSPSVELPVRLQSSAVPPELPAQFDQGYESGVWSHEFDDTIGRQPPKIATAGDLFLRPPIMHTVRDGDTLRSLAEKYLGDPQRYVEIVDANRGKIPQFTLLPIGLEIVIPRQ